MLLTFPSFSGILPKKSAYSLPKNYAQTALNCKLWGGVLEPINAPGAITIGPNNAATLANNGTNRNGIYRHGLASPVTNVSWVSSFSNNVKASFCRSPIAGDTREITFVTGGQSMFPCYFDASSVTDASLSQAAYSSQPLKISAPTSAPSATPGGTSNGVIEARAYVVTFLRRSIIEDESGPSPVVTCSVGGGQTVTLNSMPTPDGSQSVSHRRIYRTATGSQGTNYYFVAEITIATTSYVDSIAGTALGEVLPSLDWLPPPDSLQGIIPVAGGMMAAFTGKDVWISEPYIPSAWHFLDTCDFPVVGLAPMGTGFIVLTKGAPYVAAGTYPAEMFLQKIDFEQACVAYASISKYYNGVIYACPDGLAYIDTSGSRVITENLMTTIEWNQLCTPTTLHGAVHDGKYYGFHSTGGFIFDPSDETGVLSTHSYLASAIFVDPQLDALFLVNTNTITRFGTGSAATYTYKTRQEELPYPSCFAWGRVVCKTYSGVTMTFKLYVDGVLAHTQTVTSSAPFRLPPNFVGRFIEVELSGTATVVPGGVGLAHSAGEFKQNG